MSILLAGIDEVGYGPKLGPLITVTSLLRAPQAHNIRGLLTRAITSSPKETDRIAVCDSKKLYSTKKGLRVLERNVLPFIAQTQTLPAYWEDLLQSFLAPMSARNKKMRTVLIPHISLAEIQERSLMLQQALNEAQVSYLPPIIQCIEPRQFNELLQATHNKATLLFDLVADMIHATLRHYDDVQCCFRLGKQGGKTFYADDIKRCFPTFDIDVVQEQRAHSHYIIQQGKRHIELHFLLNGEDRSFTIALASIIGKYFRELAMAQLNAYWNTLVPGIRPTAGYLPDADRFLSDIHQTRENLGIPDELVIRSR